MMRFHPVGLHYSARLSSSKAYGMRWGRSLSHVVDVEAMFVSVSTPYAQREGGTDVDFVRAREGSFYPLKWKGVTV